MPPTDQPTLMHAADGALLLVKDGSTRLEQREFWSAILVFGGLGIAFLIWPLFVPPPVPGTLWVLTGMLGIVALGAVVVAVGKLDHRADRGSWRLEATGVEFRSLAGATSSLRWDDVERVYWTEGGVCLQGPAGRVPFSPRTLTTADWQTLRARIAAELAPRFDLTAQQPREPIHFGRLALVVVPIGLLAAWFRWVLPALTLDQLRWSALVMLGFLILPVLLASSGPLALLRRNPAWHQPRATPTDAA